MPRKLLAALLSAAAMTAAAPPRRRSCATRSAPTCRRCSTIYRDLHANPELSMQETRSAGIMAAEARRLGFTVTTGVGGTGVVAVLENGPGPVLMLRADMDGAAGRGADRPALRQPGARHHPRRPADRRSCTPAATTPT